MIYRTLFVETFFEASQTQEPFTTYPDGRMISETVLLVGLGFHYYINLQVQLSARGPFDLSKKDGKIFLYAK